MVFPIRDVVQPAVLRGQTNGRLPDSLLVDTPGLAGGPVVRLVAPAARAWRALCAAAAAAGHTITSTSLYDSYRPYSVQESTFRARYTTTRIVGVATKVWQGQTWYQRPGTAVAAVPGTSNHGLGLADDVADVDRHLPWLLANADRFGFSWELQSEPWHIRYYRGDAIPAAVIAHEEDTMALRDDPDGLALIKRVEALCLGKPAADFKIPNEKTPRHEVNAVAGALTALQAQLAAQGVVIEHLAAAVTAGGGTVDTAAILAGVDARLAVLRSEILADTRDAVADEAEGGAAAVRAGGPAA